MNCSGVPQVANLACSMSSNEEGVKMVRLAAAEIEKLCPQVRSGTHAEILITEFVCLITDAKYLNIIFFT